MSLDCRHIFKGALAFLWCGASSKAESPSASRLVSGKAGGQNPVHRAWEHESSPAPTPSPFPRPRWVVLLWESSPAGSFLFQNSTSNRGQLLPSGKRGWLVCSSHTWSQPCLGEFRPPVPVPRCWERLTAVGRSFRVSGAAACACPFARFIISSELVTGLSTREIHLLS